MRSPKPGVSVTVSFSRTPFSWMAVGKFLLSHSFAWCVKVILVCVVRVSVVFPGDNSRSMPLGRTHDRNNVLISVDFPKPLLPACKEETVNFLVVFYS